MGYQNIYKGGRYESFSKNKEPQPRRMAEDRTQGIGGSDVSIIAGINPFKSVYQLWLEKTGQIEPEQADSEAAHFGTLLEPIVRREFMQRTGLKVRQKNMLLQSEDYPFMIADVDGVINENGEKIIFEVKTASSYKQEICEDGVPAEYVLQVQHYMFVTGARKTYVAALVGGNHFYCHKVERDDDMIKKIIAMEKYFWEENVIGGVEPIPDGSEATTNSICENAVKLTDEELHKQSWNDFVMSLDPDYEELVQYLKERRLYVNEPIIIEEEV